MLDLGGHQFLRILCLHIRHYVADFEHGTSNAGTLCGLEFVIVFQHFRELAGWNGLGRSYLTDACRRIRLLI